MHRPPDDPSGPERAQTMNKARLLENKVALITGGGSHMGEAAALLFGEVGASVVVAHDVLADARSVAARISAAGGKAIAVQLDPTRQESIDAMVKATLDWGGKIDCMFQGQYIVGVMKPVLELSDAEWRSALDVNLDGSFRVCRAVAPHMIAAGHGAIVLVCSGRATQGGKGYGSYAASKGGILSLTKVLQWELGPHNVAVNCIAPGMIVTEAVKKVLPQEKLDALAAADPMGRLGTAEEIASFILYLCTDGQFITGQFHNLRTYTE